MIKNFLIRLFAYPFCLFMIFWGCKMSFDTPNYPNPIYSSKAKIYGLPLIIMASIYLISDVTYQIKKTFFGKKD